MSKFRVILAALLVVAVATPAMAFKVSWKGDFNNRLFYTSNVGAKGLSSHGPFKYVNVGDLSAGKTKEADADASQFQVEVKYRLIFNGKSDDGKVKAQLGFEYGALEIGDELDIAGDEKNTEELMYANISFVLPFDEASTVTIGQQKVKYNKWLWNDKAGGIKLASKRGDVKYSLAWWLDDYAEGGTAEPTNIFGADVKFAPAKAVKATIFGLYLSNSDDEMEEIHIGAEVMGKAGDIAYYVTGIYQTGDVNATLERSAFLFNGEVSTKVADTKLKLGYLYASGDDNGSDTDVDNFHMIDGGTHALGSVALHDSFADDNSVVNAPYIQDKGLSTVYVHAQYGLSKKSSVAARYFWHATAEDVQANGDDQLGHEFVLAYNYKFNKNLSAGLQAGYLIGGDAWDDLGTGTDSDDLFVTEARFRLKF